MGVEPSCGVEQLMRVLYYHQHFTTPSGSGGTRSYEFARALLAAGHQVTMVCGSHDRAAMALPFDARRGWSRGEVDGIDVIALPLEYSNRQGLLERTGVFLRYALKGVQLAFIEPHDVLFATSTPLTAGIPGIVEKLLRPKSRFVFEVRDLWPELPRALGMKNPLLLGGMSVLEWLSYRAADACVGLSPGIRDGIRQRSRPSLPVVMIPNGCDLELFHPRLRAPLELDGIEPGSFVAAFTGAHGIANGLDAVLDAARVLQQRGRRDIQLLLIGDGGEKPRLQQRAREQQLDNCHFLPLMKKTELARLCASLDCGLQILADVPAFYYGTSPNKFFDYLASGLPVITNYPGWLAELVTQHRCGIAVPPGRPDAFADALEQLADQRDEAQAMGQRARTLAETEFSRAALSGRVVELLEGQGVD